MTKEEANCISMLSSMDLIEMIQGRIYCYDIIPLEKRDELSNKLFEVRKELEKFYEKICKD